MYLLDKKPMCCLGSSFVFNSSNFSNRRTCFGDSSFKFLPYQLDGSVADYRGVNG